MFLKRYGLLVKILINYQMVCLEQMYIIFLNLSENHYSQDCNELILIQQSLNEVHFHHSYPKLFYFQCFQVISLFQVLNVRVSIFNFKCNSIFNFIYIYSNSWIITIFPMFFKNILKIILNI